MNIKDFAEKYIKAEDEAWQNGNFTALEKLEDPNVIYHCPPLPDGVGFESHKKGVLESRQMISNLQQHWEYITGEGNLFALSYKSSGMYLREVPGMPPPGKKYTTDYLCLFRVKNGRMIETWMNGTMTVLS